MAENIVSPGVFLRENDISFVQPAPVEAATVFVGPTVKGKVDDPQVVTSYNDFTRKFGSTFKSGSENYEYFTSMAVRNFFSQGGGTAMINRVVSGSFTEAESTDMAKGGNFPCKAGRVFTTDISTGFDLTGSATFPLTVTDVTLSGSSVPGGDAIATFVFATSQSLTSATITAGGTAQYSHNDIIIIPSQSLGSDKPDGADLTLRLNASDLEGGANPFELATISEGELMNNFISSDIGAAVSENSDNSLVSGSADNLRWEIANVNASKGTFSLLVRRGDDRKDQKVILETFTNLSLDPNSDNYIERVIGNQYKSIQSDGTTKYLDVVGDYPNRSNYIRVKSVNNKLFDYLGLDGKTVGSQPDGTSFSASLPAAVSGGYWNADGEVMPGALFGSDILSNSTNAQGIEASGYENAIALLSNRDEFVFETIAAPGVIYENSNFTATVNSFISLVENRGDAIFVADMAAYGSSVANVTLQADTLNSSYAATYWPHVQLRSETGKDVFVPASVVIPGVFAANDNAAAPWFAPAGLVRGGIPGVIRTERKLPASSRDSLYDAKVNPIATFPGQGIAVFGQKTLQTKASALDRVNVRRLMIELKKYIGDIANTLVFEQNTIATRNRFLAQVNPYLDNIVQRQGLYSYRVVMDDTNNTSDVIDRNQIVGQVYVQPTKTAEFVIIDFVLEPTGATFS